MDNKDKYQCFSFFKKVATNVLTKLIEIDSNKEMLDIIRNEYQETEKYPDNTLNTIIQRITDKDILNDLENILKYNEDCMENFFNYIFFPEDEEEECEDENNFDIPTFSIDQYPIEDEQLQNDDNCSNYNDDDDDDDNDINCNTKVKFATFYTPESLKDRIQKQIEEITKKLPISANLAYLLLKKFNWNEEQIISQWYSKVENILSILKELHVPEVLIKDDLQVKNIGLGECPLCAETDVELYQLYCGHSLCFNCWKEEIEAQLENIILKVTPVHCRLDECGSEIMISDIQRFCGENKAKMYEDSITKNQTFNDKKLIKCPAPDCPYFISIMSLSSGSVATCKCGKQVCWHCHEYAHSPLKCGKLEEWNRIESEMARVIREQDEWIRREKELTIYRFNHIDEVKNTYDQFNDRLLREHEAANQREVAEIQNLEEEMTKAKDDERYQRFLNLTISQKQIDHNKKMEEREKARKSIIEDQKNHIKRINDFMLYAYEYGGRDLEIKDIQTNFLIKNDEEDKELNNICSRLSTIENNIDKKRIEIEKIQKNENENAETKRKKDDDDDDIDEEGKKQDQKRVQLLRSEIYNLERERELLYVKRRDLAIEIKKNRLKRIPLEIERINRKMAYSEITNSEREMLSLSKRKLEKERTLLESEVGRQQMQAFDMDEEIERVLFERKQDMMKRIMQYDNDDSKFKTNEEFIAEKTRKCPQCGVIIQKNGGCNHLTCARCLYQFCWLCGNEWKGVHKSCPLYGPLSGLPENNPNTNNNNNNNSGEDANNENRSFRLPPINYIFAKKHNMWKKCLYDYNRILNECEQEEKGYYANSRKEAYERAKLIFTLDKVDEKFKKIIQTYNNARNILLHSYAAVFFMDHESGAFASFQNKLDALNRIYFELARILIASKPDEPFRPIVHLSKRTNSIVNEILNAF